LVLFSAKIAKQGGMASPDFYKILGVAKDASQEVPLVDGGFFCGLSDFSRRRSSASIESWRSSTTR
jgi:hypothetical protein